MSEIYKVMTVGYNTGILCKDNFYLLQNVRLLSIKNQISSVSFSSVYLFFKSFETSHYFYGWLKNPGCFYKQN